MKRKTSPEDVNGKYCVKKSISEVNNEETKSITINLIDANGAVLQKSIGAAYDTNTKQLTDLCNKDSCSVCFLKFHFFDIKFLSSNPILQNVIIWSGY